MLRASTSMAREKNCWLLEDDDDWKTTVSPGTVKVMLHVPQEATVGEM